MAWKEKKSSRKKKQKKIREFGKDALGNLILRDFRQMMGDLKPLPTVVAENTNETDEEFDARMQEMMNDERYINQDPSFTRKVEMEFERRHPD